MLLTTYAFIQRILDKEKTAANYGQTNLGLYADSHRFFDDRGTVRWLVLTGAIFVLARREQKRARMKSRFGRQS